MFYIGSDIHFRKYLLNHDTSLQSYAHSLSFGFEERQWNHFTVRSIILLCLFLLVKTVVSSGYILYRKYLLDHDTPLHSNAHSLSFRFEERQWTHFIMRNIILLCPYLLDESVVRQGDIHYRKYLLDLDTSLHYNVHSFSLFALKKAIETVLLSEIFLCSFLIYQFYP